MMLFSAGNNGMYVRFILFMVYFIMSSLCYAIDISGIIVNRVNNKPVPSIAISLKGSTVVAVSDKNGAFVIHLQNKMPVQLSVSHVSYKPLLLSFPAPVADTTVYVFIEEKNIHLDEVGVTATTPRVVTTESYSQSNIDNIIIDEKIATSLIDVLEQSPGITKKGEYHSPIVLRGLGGKRLLVTKDGNRRMGNFSGGFMGQNINIYDLAKVEIIKGPASVMYGPGAIAGIINMESKYPFSIPGLHGKVQTQYGTNNREKTVLGSLNWTTLEHSLSFSTRWREAGDYRAGNGDTMQNSGYGDKDFRLSYSYEGNMAMLLTAETELHLGGPWGRPVGFNGTDYVRVTNNKDDVWHSSVTANWKPQQRLNRIELSVYFDKELRQQLKDSYDAGSSLLSYREDVSFKDYYAGWRERTVIKPNSRLEINTGLDGVCYRVESPSVETDYFLNTTIRNRVSKDAGVFLSGIYAETGYSYSPKLKLRVGWRGDYSSIREGLVHDTSLSSGRSGRVTTWNGTSGLVYALKGKYFLSFQIARSCRLPDASEMFIITSNSDGIIYGNPELTPEYGLNLDAGLRGTTGVFTFDLSPFCNFLHDFISLEYWLNSGKKGINYIYYNIDRARIFGVELSTGVMINGFLHPDAKLMYNGSYVVTQGDRIATGSSWFDVGDALRNIPPLNTTQEITLRRMINTSNSWYAGIDVRCYATQNRIAPSADGGYVSYSYVLLGSSMGFSHKKKGVTYDYKLKMDNLTNNPYRPFESLVYNMGRNVKVMVAIMF